MSLDQIHSFVAVAEEGALVRAAARLHITQPPLTRRIHNLEQELGTELFERLPRGMVLTEAGETFLPLAREILASVEVAVARIAASRPKTGRAGDG